MGVDVLAATTTWMLLDFAAVRVDPQKVSQREFTLNVERTDRGERRVLRVDDGVLARESGFSDARAGATVRMQRPLFIATLLGGQRVATHVDAELVELIEPIVPNFPVVTP